MKTKFSLMLIALVMLSGCISLNSFYILSTASQPAVTYSSKHRVIGVEKVSVPKYLFYREIAVAKSSSQVTFLPGASWAEDLDEGLTQRLIGFLQKKFNQPDVYLYPWGVDRQPDIKVKVQITRFIAQGERVYLDASWEVENMHTHQRKARLFSTTVSTGSGASEIVSAMDRAFGEPEEALAKGVREE